MFGASVANSNGDIDLPRWKRQKTQQLCISLFDFVVRAAFENIGAPFVEEFCRIPVACVQLLGNAGLEDWESFFSRGGEVMVSLWG